MTAGPPLRLDLSRRGTVCSTAHTPRKARECTSAFCDGWRQYRFPPSLHFLFWSPLPVFSRWSLDS